MLKFLLRREYGILFLLLFAINTQAAETVRMVFPENGQNGIGIHPLIKLVTSHPIDTSSLVPETPYYIVGDSTNYEVFESNILILETHYFNDEPDSLYSLLSISGDIFVAGTDTINISLHNLLTFENEYTIIVQGLKVLTPDTVTIDTVFSPAFSTSYLPPSYSGSSLDLIREALPNDTIKIYFSDNLLKYKRENINIEDYLSSISKIYKDSTTIESEYILGIDSTYIEIKPTQSLSLDSMYVLSVDLSFITGDSVDYFLTPFHVKSHSLIKLNVFSMDTTTELPEELIPDNGIGDYIAFPGDTIEVSTPDVYNDYYFVKWNCSSDIKINDSLSNPFKFAIEVNNLNDRFIHAEYSLIQNDTITLIENTGGHANVINYSDSLTENLYYIKRNPENIYEIIALADSGHHFLHWVSNDQRFNNNDVPHIYFNFDSPVISEGNIRNIHFQPIFIEDDEIQTDPCSTATLCVKVILHNVDWKGLKRLPTNLLSDIYGIIDNDEIFIDGTPYSLNIDKLTGIACTEPFNFNGGNSITKTISCSLSTNYSDCYEILCCLFMGKYQWGSISNPVGSSFQIQLKIDDRLTDCSGTLVVHLIRKVKILTVEHEALGNTELYTTNSMIKFTPKGKIITSEYNNGTYTYYPFFEKGYNCGNISVYKKRIDKYYYYCGEQINAKKYYLPPGINNGYTLEWNSSSGYVYEDILIDGSLDFTINSDSKIGLQLTDNEFRLKYICLHKSDNSGDFIIYRVNNYPANEYPLLSNRNQFKDINNGVGLGYRLEPQYRRKVMPEGDCIGYYYHKNTTLIKFIFNKRVDEYSLKNNLYLEAEPPNCNPFDWEYYQYSGTFFDGYYTCNYVSTEGNQFCERSSYDKPPGNGKITGAEGCTVEFLFYLEKQLPAKLDNENNYAYITHGTPFIIHINNNIKSYDNPNEYLYSGYNDYHLITTLPSLYLGNLTFINEEIFDDDPNDESNLDLFFHCISIIRYRDMENIDHYQDISNNENWIEIYNNQGIRMPAIGFDQNTPNQNNYFSDRSTIMYVPHLKTGDDIYFGIHGINANNGTSLSNSSTIFNWSLDYIKSTIYNNLYDKNLGNDFYNIAAILYQKSIPFLFAPTGFINDLTILKVNAALNNENNRVTGRIDKNEYTGDFKYYYRAWGCEPYWYGMGISIFRDDKKCRLWIPIIIGDVDENGD